MQHRDHAEFGTEVLGVGGNGAQRLGRCAAQDRVHHGLVLEGDPGDGRGHGEDDVEVGHRQQLGLSCGEPCSARQALALRAMSVAA